MFRKRWWKGESSAAPGLSLALQGGDEEAALAAQDAGLELEGETAEEAAADQLAQEAPSAEDKFAGKGKEELVALFMRMLEEQPVQSIRRDVEALKIAFYRIRRAEVEAARRRFVEEGGAEEDFAPSVDGAEIQLKEQLLQLIYGRTYLSLQFWCLPHYSFYQIFMRQQKSMEEPPARSPDILRCR